MFDYRVNDRLTLKLIDYQDTKDLFQLISNSRSHLETWGNWVAPIQSEADTERLIKKYLLQFAEQRGMHFLIEFEGKPAGTISLKQLSWDVNSGEIGYWLSHDYVGKGIVTQATEAIIEYGFRHINLHKIEIWAADKNEKSKRVPERLGFVKEGVRRDNEFLNGQYYTMAIYGLLKSEWQEQKQKGN